MATSSAPAADSGGGHAGSSSGILGRLSTHHVTITIVGICLALLGVGMLIAVVLIANVSSDASAIADRHARYAVAIDAAALHAKAMANDERGFLLSGDEEFALQMDIREGLATARFADALDAAPPQNRDALVEAQTGFDVWLAAVERSFDLYRAGQHDEAVAASFGESRELRKEYEAALALAREFAHEGIDAASEAISSSTTLAIFILVDYLLIAIAIGLVLIGILLRMVRRTARVAPA